jgi:N-glycosylase/DNA lyase
MRAVLEVPAGFRFDRTVFGHGWATLPPFRFDAGRRRLESVVALPRGGAVRIRLSAAQGGVLVEAPGRSSAFLRQVARRMLNLETDFSGFYCAAREHEEFAWIAETGAGRLLRCPTLFEDLAKLILTTNCTWAFTTRMVRALVDSFGELAADGSRSFPTPRAIARAGERELRERVRAGYRAPSLARLAALVARGRVDPEAWEQEGREAALLRREMLELPGVGPYVAENMLRFLGRPHGLGLDSWLRAKYYRTHHEGRRVTDRTIARRYARFGRWAGLALWCEMTRDWFDDGGPSAAWDSLN